LSTTLPSAMIGIVHDKGVEFI